MPRVIVVVLIAAAAYCQTVGPAAAIGTTTPPAALDGDRPLDPPALAALAKQRALLGARWLASVVQHDGSYHYIYDPGTDRYENLDYNEVRHAGTTYALYQV